MTASASAFISSKVAIFPESKNSYSNHGGREGGRDGGGGEGKNGVDRYKEEGRKGVI